MVAETTRNLPPGALIEKQGVAPGHGVYAVAGDGDVLELLEVQLEGRKRMPAEVFANGQRIGSKSLTHTDRLGA